MPMTASRAKTSRQEPRPRSVEAPRVEAEREERHGDAQAAVGAELHDDAGEQHGGGGGRGDVAGRRPGVEGPEAGENGEADEDQREAPHLEVTGKVGVGESDEARGSELPETA